MGTQTRRGWRLDRARLRPQAAIWREAARRGRAFVLSPRHQQIGAAAGLAPASSPPLLSRLRAEISVRTTGRSSLSYAAPSLLRQESRARETDIEFPHLSPLGEITVELRPRGP